MKAFEKLKEETGKNYKMGEVLFKKEKIQKEIKQLAEHLTLLYPKDKEVVFIVLMNGALPFSVDLLKNIQRDFETYYIKVQSYMGLQSRDIVTETLEDLIEMIKDKHVIIVDDIMDSGKTMFFIKSTLEEFAVALSIRACVLLDKEAKREERIQPDFKVFTCPDKFVIGYGLDLYGYFRNLEDIYTIEEEGFDNPFDILQRTMVDCYKGKLQEATDSPYWIVIDPSILNRRKKRKITFSEVACCIHGVFFSREEAEGWYLENAYNYSDEARIFCNSGWRSKKYKKLWEEARRIAQKETGNENL